MIKVSDYIASRLSSLGIKHVFCVQGGAVAHLIDSVGERFREHGDIEYICTAHEQAAAMAVDGYVRTTGGLGAAMVTTGPGVMNLLTGIACLYYDSLPAIFIGGNVSTFRLRRETGVRQLGFQEADHRALVSSVVKHYVLIERAEDVEREFSRAVEISLSGRPGPVFIDICDDVQRAMMETPEDISGIMVISSPKQGEDSSARIEYALKDLRVAQRPVIVLGAGVRIAECEALARRFMENVGVPVALTWAMQDFLPENHPLNVGSFGISASRRGNFAVQNADYILSIGSRLDTHATGTPVDTFARDATKFVIDIDQTELAKFPESKGWYPINADVCQFFADVQKAKWFFDLPKRDCTKWISQIAKWRESYPAVKQAWRDQKTQINPYHFLEVLSEECDDNAIIIPDCGGNLIQTFQAFRIRKSGLNGQRLFSAFNASPMGYSLCAAIGAAFAVKGSQRQIICIIGDGGLQVNIQELATVVRHNLPIKIFLFNNHGYGIIQQTQEDWLDGRLHGSRPETGLSDPDYMAIASAFRMMGFKIYEHTGMRSRIKWALNMNGPTLINLEMSPDQRLEPFLKAGRPIEDAQPLLERDEFIAQMIGSEPLDVSR